MKSSVLLSLCLLSITLIIECTELESCTHTDSRDGFCKKFKNCPEVIKAYQVYNIRPEICKSNSYLICCPEPEKKDELCTSNRISCQKCQQYSDALYKDNANKCGHTTLPLIIGGTPAAKGEFPHMALIGYENSKNDDDYLCGGSLISERWVLSAAHCSFSFEFGAAKYVKLGDVIRRQNNENTYKFEIIQRLKHPKYSIKLIDNDIMLFKLDRDVVFGRYVLPICLPYFDKTPKKSIVTGWGLTENYQKSDILLKVNVEVFKETDCQSKYASEGKIVNGIDYTSKICAGSHNAKNDTCSGDSGGPLQVFNLNQTPCMFSIIGITSFGHAGCGLPGVPGIYTRVFNYLDWIEENVWPANKVNL